MPPDDKMLITIGEIIQELVVAQEEGKDVNLNKLKSKISSKYGLKSQPRLVDIIAAVPIQHRKMLVPKLKAKPIRTASGVRIALQLMYKVVFHRDLVLVVVLMAAPLIFLAML